MTNDFPFQKISSTGKTKKWFKDCIINGVNITLNESNSVKPDIDVIEENYRIYDGERDTSSMKKAFDPLSNLNPNYKPNFKSFSVIRDRINELVGEYIERSTEYVIAAIDRDAVNKKIAENKQRLTAIVQKIIADDSIKDEEEIRRKLEDAVNFKFMSKAEVAANKVLNFYKNNNRVKYKEIEGFLDSLITAMVSFNVYIENNTLKVDLLNPKEVFAVRNGNSNNITDSEMISIINYFPKTKILDKYGEYFSKSDLKRIFDSDFKYTYGGADINKRTLSFNSLEELNKFTKNLENPASYESPVDNNGNIRVVEFRWKGYRKVFKRKYYDDNGEVAFDYVSEHYKPDEDKGEVLTARWIPEWHEGTLIGSDIVVKARVSPYQYRNVKNPTKNSIGIVGRYFNTGNNKAKSLVDLVKSYLYLRDFVFAKIEDLLAKNIGKVIEVDVDTFPDKWNTTRVLYYLKRFNIAVKSSLAEGKKGKAKGKLAGAFSSGTRVLDAELGASIGYLSNLLVLLDDMIAKVTGVTNQRLGAIHNRELVGNVERSRVQSSLITEILFIRYEQVILDLYSTILEVSKRAIDKDDRLQFVLDDYSYGLLTNGLSDFKSTDFGLFPVNSKKYEKLKNIIEQVSLQAIANGSMKLTQLISMYDSKSTLEMIDKQYKIEKDQERMQRDLEKRKGELRKEEYLLQQASNEYVKEMELNFKVELEKIKGDYQVLLKSLGIKEKALSEYAKQLLEIDRTKIEDNYKKAKLELDRQVLKNSNTQARKN